MTNIRRDEFEIYKNGVKRLQEMRRELNALHAEKKFPVEVASIAAKLKSVSEIPQIELELSELKKKISGKFIDKKQGIKKIIIHADKKEIEHLKEDIDKKVRTINSFSKLKSETELLKLKIEQLEKTEDDIKEKFEGAKLKPVNAQLKNIKQDFDKKISSINTVSKIKSEVEELKNKILLEETGKKKDFINFKVLEENLGLLRNKVNGLFESQKNKLSRFISKEEFNVLKKELEKKTANVASNITIANLRAELSDLRKDIERKIENAKNNPALNNQFELILDRIEFLEKEENSQRNKETKDIGMILMLKNQIDGLKNLVNEFSEREDSEIRKLQSEYSSSVKKNELQDLKEEVENKIRYALSNPNLRKNLNELKKKIYELEKQEKSKNLEDVREDSKKEIKISRLNSEIKFLREKIAEEEEKLDKTKISGATKTELQNLKEEVENKIRYASNNPRIRANLNELREKINELGEINEVIEKKLRYASSNPKLRKELEELNRKIVSIERAERKHFEEEISETSKKNSAINNLNKEIGEIKNKLDEQEKKQNKKLKLLHDIDPFVDSLSSNMFSLSFEDLKNRLSEEFRRREIVLKEQVEQELRKRELEYKKEYSKLEGSLKEDYYKRLSLRLDKDVKSRINELESTYHEKIDNLNDSKKRELEILKKREKELTEQKEKYQISILDKLEELEELYEKKDAEMKLSYDRKIADLNFTKNNELKKIKESEEAMKKLIERAKKAEAMYRAKIVSLETASKKAISDKIKEIENKLKFDYQKKLKEEIKKNQIELKKKLKKIL